MFSLLSVRVELIISARLTEYVDYYGDEKRGEENIAVSYNFEIFIENVCSLRSSQETVTFKA